jgi:hypothetical protein
MYNYKYFCNYWDYIPITKIKNKIFLDFLSKLINENRLSPFYDTKTNKQKKDYYKWLYLKTLEINKNNKKYKNDKFWLYLTKIIVENKITKLNEENISLIKSML